MTVKIGSMNAVFDNVSTSYVAVGMRVTDNGSAANSKLLYFEVNNSPRMDLNKDGRLTISSNVGSNISLLHMTNKGNSVVNITSNLTSFQSNVYLGRTTHVRGYSEGFRSISVANSVLFLDLSEASVFSVTSSNSSISRIVFIKPNVPEISSVDKAYSCTVIFRGITNIANSAWTTNNVRWPTGANPAQPTGTVIYTFLNVTDAANIFTSSWYGIDLGSNFTL